MQIFAIHGGNAFLTYEEYLSHLRTMELTKERLQGWRDWKAHLNRDLGEGYEVFTPSMPSSRNAKYLEWKIWFEKMFPFMEDGVVLIGHSLGGLFLAKFLSEEAGPERIGATLLVAPPHSSDGGRPIVEFTLPASLENLSRQGGKIFLYHSKDDPVVEFGELAKYQAALPQATTRVFEDRGHFNQEQFPEILEDIRSLKEL